MAEARFFRADDTEMFECVLDNGSTNGPRPATREDRRKYPRAWAKFKVGESPAAPIIEKLTSKLKKKAR